MENTDVFDAANSIVDNILDGNRSLARKTLIDGGARLALETVIALSEETELEFDDSVELLRRLIDFG